MHLCIPSDTKVQRPADETRLVLITPGLDEFIPDEFERVAPLLGLVALRGRPAIQKASELVQVPRRFHTKGWRRDLFERKGDGLVSFLQITDAFRPVRSQYPS